jgi:hypothetical protein
MRSSWYKAADFRVAAFYDNRNCKRLRGLQALFSKEGTRNLAAAQAPSGAQETFMQFLSSTKQDATIYQYAIATVI